MAFIKRDKNTKQIMIVYNCGHEIAMKQGIINSGIGCPICAKLAHRDRTIIVDKKQPRGFYLWKKRKIEA